MKYFLVSEDKELSERPQMINWYTKIPERYMRWGTYHKVPARTVIFVKENKNIYFPDIITFPFFMISKKIKEVLDLYEPNMGYRQIILIERHYQYVFQYFVPHLPIINCMSPKSKFNMDNSYAIRLILESDKLEDKCVFEIAGLKNRHIIVRLDFLESILRRDGILDFTEIEVERLDG